MLKIQPDGSFAEPKDLAITEERHNANTVKQAEGEQDMNNLITKYSHLFQGIGKIEDRKNGREILSQFHMKPRVVPVAQKPRQVQYYLQAPLKKVVGLRHSRRYLRESTLPDDEPVTCCSHLVVLPKPRFAGLRSDLLEPYMIRASVDLRVPNQYMERSRISQAPIVEDFIQKFHDCTIWTKLDLRQGYHQLELHPESRSVATFSTPWGNFRPRRPVFGGKASQDVFDEAMYKIFERLLKITQVTLTMKLLTLCWRTFMLTIGEVDWSCC